MTEKELIKKREITISEYDSRRNTLFSSCYPNSKEFNSILMPSQDINMGFSTFKKAKGIGPIKNFKHKLSGKFKDPIQANKKFFKANPGLI